MKVESLVYNSRWGCSYTRLTAFHLLVLVLLSRWSWQQGLWPPLQIKLFGKAFLLC